MKIEKLYTLSQFVDWINTEDAATEFSEGYQLYIPGENKSELVINYNNFLKQPLKKEMFVNELEKPKSPKTYEEYLKFEAWEKIEKKVIFKESEYNGSLYIVNGFKFRFNEYLTLHALAEATNGELELKNVFI